MAPLSPMSPVAPIFQTSNLLPVNQLPVKKLRGPEDWNTWLEVLIRHAEILEFWKVITGDEKKPEETDAIKLQQWKKKDLCAMELILNSISQEMRAELELEYEQFNSATMTSKELLGKIHVKMLIEPELERYVALQNFVTRFNPLAGNSFASTGAFMVDLMQEWTKLKAKYPDTSDKWLKKVTIVGLQSFAEVDEP